MYCDFGDGLWLGLPYSDEISYLSPFFYLILGHVFIQSHLIGFIIKSYANHNQIISNHIPRYTRLDVLSPSRYRPCQIASWRDSMVPCIISSGEFIVFWATHIIMKFKLEKNISPKGKNISYWLVVDLPLWKKWKSVRIIIPNIWKNTIHVPHHQSAYHDLQARQVRPYGEDSPNPNHDLPSRPCGQVVPANTLTMFSEIISTNSWALIVETNHNFGSVVVS